MTWVDLIATTHVGGALPVEVTLEGAAIRFAMTVPDLETNEPREIYRVVPAPDLHGYTAAMHHWLLDQVLWLYVHEAKEQLWIGGERAFAPHEEHA